MPNCHLRRIFCPVASSSKTRLLKLTAAMLCTLTVASTSMAPAFCQGFSFQGSVNITPPGLPAPPNLPGFPGLPQLPGLPGISISTSGGANGLPPCNLDSFVYQAGGQAEYIYGDEGVGTKPPISSFTTASRINSGIQGYNDAGLTTGHGSYMPDAWGADEFIQAPGEWGPTGAGSGAASIGAPPQMGGDGDQTQTKEAGNSAAGSGGNGLLTVPTNGDLSLVWNPPPPPSNGIIGGTGGGSDSGGSGFSIPGLNIGVGPGGVSVGVSIPGL